MHPTYKDILALTDKTPLWWDNNGVPRYRPYHPDMLGVYDRYSALYLIECQACTEKFLVGNGLPAINMQSDPIGTNSLSELISGSCYGDSPMHGSCSGYAMTSIDLAVIEAWEKINLEWTRVPALEGAYDLPDWTQSHDTGGRH